MPSTLTAQPDLMAILEDGGHRSTGPRRDVINAIERRGESFSADELSSVNRRDVERRFRLFSELSQFALERDGEVVPWRGSPVT